MYGPCHVNGTRWTKKVGQLKLLYEGFKPQSGGPSFSGDPSRHHVLKKRTYHFLYISLLSSEGYSRYKTKVKVKNNLTEPFPPLIKNTKGITICYNHPLPFLTDVICTQSLKVM